MVELIERPATELADMIRNRKISCEETLDAFLAQVVKWNPVINAVVSECRDEARQTAKQLDEKLTTFLGTEDTILYTSCFDANGGLFETLLNPDDAVISDELNHASIIDGAPGRHCITRFRRSTNSSPYTHAPRTT